MMSAAYIDSESDEEEENEQSLPKGAHVQIQDIQKVPVANTYSCHFR